jgi:hypothetical protein
MFTAGMANYHRNNKKEPEKITLFVAFILIEERLRSSCKLIAFPLDAAE